MGAQSDNSIDAAGISKRFRFRSNARQATLKDVIVRRERRERRYVQALDDVTFSLPRGQTLGVIGANGSGKTTLLRVLAGITKPDRGEARLRGNVAPLLALGTGFNVNLTGRENALIELLTLGMSRAEAKSHLPGVIEFSELGEFIDAPMRTYSAGMTARLAFAAAIRVDPEILLIDEILSVGDERFAVKCQGWLEEFRGRGKTTVMVTHSTGIVAAQCDAALWLQNGRLAGFGEPARIVHEYVKAMHSDERPERANANNIRMAFTGLVKQVRLPLIGDVRQEGVVSGAFEDGWTNGALEFAFEPLRDVRGWTIRATIPPGMPSIGMIAAEVDGAIVSTAPATPGEVLLRCEMQLARGRATTLRVRSSPTVNHHALGISGDRRDIGARIDEIVFDH